MVIGKLYIIILRMENVDYFYRIPRIDWIYVLVYTYLFFSWMLFCIYTHVMA